jgi:hypothetical protein
LFGLFSRPILSWWKTNGTAFIFCDLDRQEPSLSRCIVTVTVKPLWLKEVTGIVNVPPVKQFGGFYTPETCLRKRGAKRHKVEGTLNLLRSGTAG